MVIIAIVLLVFIAIQTDYVQNKLVTVASKRLSKSLGTEVSVKKVSLTLFNRFNMDGALIRDQQQDTLLYAGQLKVRITDWFFLKDKAILKYIGLEDAVIKLQRKDSVWNYGFIADYFASSEPRKKKSGTIDLDLKKLDFKNLRFLKNDLWVGERMEVAAGSLLVNAESVDLGRSIFLISDIHIDKPLFAIHSLKALRPDSLRKRKASVDTGMYFNAGNMLVKAKKLKISNGRLFINGNEEKPMAHFDGAHIQLSRLNGTLSSLSFIKDTLRADVDLAVKDRSGLELRKLKTKFRLTPQIMELAALDLQTNRSRLGNYYAMHFKDFNKDFGNYIHQVTMQARFRNAHINSDDLAYFAPELKSWNRIAKISGHFLGTVDDFTVNSLAARIGNTTSITGVLNMQGLPDINTTRINFSNGTLVTNYNDVGNFIPQLKNITDPNLAALGTIIYRGNFKGTTGNFVTAGVFSTQLGGVTANVSMKLPRRGDPSYTGSIETNRFNIGRFLNTAGLGLVNFKGKITGSSFNINRLITRLDGNISSLDFNHYTYTNIVTNGTFQKKYFSGEVKIDDPNLDFTSNVEIDFSKEHPSFNVVGDLAQSNLKELHFLDDHIELTGLLDANFTGTNIDNFSGTAKFLSATIRDESTRLSFDSLNLTSGHNDTAKVLRLGSNHFTASITGKFSILDLPASFQSFLHHYYPAYVPQAKYTPENQQFRISVSTNYIEPYLRIFSKRISGFNDVSLSGSVDTRRSDLRITAGVPYGKFDNYVFSGVELKGSGNMDTLSLAGEINSIQVSDSIRFPNTRLTVRSKDNHSVVSIKTSATNTLNDADLYADIYTLEDGVRIQFRPSSFVLNEKKWNIEKEGELTIRKSFVDARNIRFTQGYQEIVVETEEEDGGNINNLIVQMRNVILGDITSLFMKEPRLEGITDGKIIMKDFFGQFNADADLKVEQFRIDDDSVGLVNIKTGYDNKTGMIPFDITSPNEGYHFSAKGSYNLKDSIDNPFNADILLNNSKIHLLQQFLAVLFTDVTGQATGNINISGNLNNPNLLGRVKLKKAGMKVNYTQVYYTIDSADIRFEEDGIDFGRFTIRDQYNNTGTVRGKLYERGFKNMLFDFELSTPQLLLIDTKLKDNAQFYGKAIGRANVSLRGPEYDARMVMLAEPTDSSHIFIPNSISRESGTADFIVFKQYGTEMEEEKKGGGFNLTVALDITANNKAKIDVILDDLTGDVIKATGNGLLRIRAGTTAPLTIRGRYNIERGNYDFNFQSFIRKPFELLPNAGNYIEWTGDPFKADIHIDAQYTAERISLSDLVENRFVDQGGSIKGYRGDVYVIAQLRGKLTHPNIKFRIDFPQGSPIKANNEFAQYLARLEKDENEILKQVTFLIVLNSFAPPGTASGGNNNNTSFSTIGVNTLSQVLAKEVNRIFSNILYKLTGDRSLQFDFGTSVYNSNNIFQDNTLSTNTGGFDRTTMNFKLGKSFFNDNVIITFGSNFDFNLKSSSIQRGNFQWLPDLNIEFVLSKDRKLRAIIFNKNSLDLSGSAGFGRRNRFGGSISYRRDFEKLFGKKEEDIEFKQPVVDSVDARGKL